MSDVLKSGPFLWGTAVSAYQVEGGNLQAIGFAHLEAVEAREGRFLQNTMSTSIIPTALDAPPMRTSIVEVPFERGPFGAKGVGEMPMDVPAPAVAAAVRHATGLLIEELPILPETIARRFE